MFTSRQVNSFVFKPEVCLKWAPPQKMVYCDLQILILIFFFCKSHLNSHFKYGAEMFWKLQQTYVGHWPVFHFEVPKKKIYTF